MEPEKTSLDSPPMRPEIFVLGANHLTASVDLRDRLLFNEATLEQMADTLKTSGFVDEFVILSTCNRSEIYGVSRNIEAAQKKMITAWTDIKKLNPGELESHSYFHHRSEAVRHLFRVMGSLDSLVLGEMQILGQVKEAYARASDKGWTDLRLNHLFQAGIHAGKRIHAETSIHEGAVSISYAAVMLAKKVLGDLKGKTVGIVGTGEMGELAAQHLHKAGASHFILFNRSVSGAERLAAEFGGEICLLPEMDRMLHRCDIVISATGAPDIVVHKKNVAHAIDKRDGYPLFLIDIAAPRDIDPACGDVDGVFLFSIDDLLAIVHENQEHRRSAADKAIAIVEEESHKIDAWEKSLDLVPLIKAMREQAMAMADQEVAKWSSGLNPEAQKALESLARGLTAKFLHLPLTRLKLFGEEGDGARAAHYAANLFGLQQESTPPSRPKDKHGSV